jgi:hypothetical protein
VFAAKRHHFPASAEKLLWVFQSNADAATGYRLTLLKQPRTTRRARLRTERGYFMIHTIAESRVHSQTLPTMMKVGIAIVTAGILAGHGLGWSAAAVAGPSDFGNAQDTIDALQAQGYYVLLNGAVVNPLSWCKVTGISGLNSSNIDSAGRRIDPTQFDRLYVDVYCRGVE